jgi:hypothetical protein
MIKPDVKWTSIRTNCKCPECTQENAKENGAMLWVEFSVQWINQLIMDCNETADHVVTVSGPWTSPLIIDMLRTIGVTREQILRGEAQA